MKKDATYILNEKMFLYLGEKSSWHFLPITKKVASEIKEKHSKNARGFGSLPVEVTIGKTIWHTSIFPDKRSGTYLLPVKAKVRKSEDIEAGEEINFSIRIR